MSRTIHFCYCTNQNHNHTVYEPFCFYFKTHASIFPARASLLLHFSRLVISFSNNQRDIAISSTATGFNSIRNFFENVHVYLGMWLRFCVCALPCDALCVFRDYCFTILPFPLPRSSPHLSCINCIRVEQKPKMLSNRNEASSNLPEWTENTLTRLRLQRRGELNELCCSLMRIQIVFLNVCLTVRRLWMLLSHCVRENRKENVLYILYVWNTFIYSKNELNEIRRI